MGVYSPSAWREYSQQVRVSRSRTSQPIDCAVDEWAGWAPGDTKKHANPSSHSNRAHRRLDAARRCPRVSRLYAGRGPLLARCPPRRSWAQPRGQRPRTWRSRPRGGPGIPKGRTGRTARRADLLQRRHESSPRIGAEREASPEVDSARTPGPSSGRATACGPSQWGSAPAPSTGTPPVRAHAPAASDLSITRFNAR